MRSIGRGHLGGNLSRRRRARPASRCRGSSGPHDNDSWDCKQIGEALAQEIESNPSAFYVEIRTEEFPNGAIRGQLGPGLER